MLDGNKDKQYKKIHWIADENDDLRPIEEKDKEQEIPDKTTILLKSFSKDLPKEQEEFLKKVVDLNAKENKPKLEKLKQAIIQNCLLKLLNVKDLNITLYYNDIEDVKITNEDLTKYNENKQEEQIEVKYKIYKTTKDHNDKDISEFVDYYEEIDGEKNYKTEKFKMDIYKLPDNFENHIYLCANDVAVKDISVKEHILPKNITIDGENNEKYKLLVLINDAEGYSFLNNHSNSERDDFNADEKLDNDNIDFTTKSTKQFIQEIKNSLFVGDYTKPILFYDDLIDNITDKIYAKFPEIKEKDDEKKEIYEKINRYKEEHSLTEEEKNILLDDRRKITNDNFYKKCNEIIGNHRGIEVEERQQKIADLQKEIMEYINNNNFNETELKTKTEQQVILVDEANKNELTCYILRRKYIIERLKKMFNSTDDKIKEQELHNLFATKRNNINANQYDKTNLWLLDDKFMVFDKLFSEKELDEITKELLKNDKLYNESFDKKDNPEENTEEKKLERAKKRRPDIVLFKDINNNLRKIVLIEFKRPDADDYDYNKGLYQLNCYANYIAKQQKVAAEYFGFLLVNTKLEIGDDFVKNSLKGEYNEIYNLSDGCRSFAKAKNLYDDNEKPIGYLNIQVIPSNAIINDAESRNFVFDKIISKKEKKIS